VAIDFLQQDLYLIGVGVDVTSSDEVPSSSEEAAKSFYDSSASSTYSDPKGAFTADDGYVTGNLSADIVNLGSLSVNMIFGDANAIDWWVNYMPIDGVLGLSFKNSTNGIPNVLNQLVPSMADPLVVEHFNVSMGSTMTDDSNSFISLGSENISQCEQEWIHPANSYYNNYALAGNMTVTNVGIAGANGSSMEINRQLYIGRFPLWQSMSDQMHMLFVEASGAVYNSKTDEYEIPCDQVAQCKNVVLTLSDGEMITLTSDDYVYRDSSKSGSPACMLNTLGNYAEDDDHDTLGFIFLGRQFFNGRCVSYNIATQQLGIALVRQN
jgi:hypothetical protein